MRKKMLMAVIVALLTAAGVVIPDRFVDKFVSLFIPTAEAMTDNFNQAYVRSPVFWRNMPAFCWCSHTSDPILLATGEALRPSSVHFSADRVRVEKIPRETSGTS